jgi:hypothetical protein
MRTKKDFSLGNGNGNGKAGNTAQYQNKACGALWGAVGRLRPFLAMGRYIARVKNAAIIGAFPAV